MNTIFIIFCSIILSTFSLEPKLCINCKFFTKEFFFDNKFGKCILFPREDLNDIDNFLVNGIVEKKKIKYNYCSIARNYDDMCGKEGKFYDNKNNKGFFENL